MQKAYINALYTLAEKDKNVLSLLSDSGTSYDELFARDFPNQCFNFGICEENKIAAAAGLAASGKIPFCYTTGAFLAYRSYEFIRNDVCFQNQNVKVVGMGSGLAWSTLGVSHHTTEDISALRALPNLTILSPATPAEVEKCVYAAYEIAGPVYIRTGMHNEAEIYDPDYQFEVGKNIVVRDGRDASVFVTGTILSEVLIAASLLEVDGISVAVINAHTIKPFDVEGVLYAAGRSSMLFTVEEHNILGGLGGIVSEIMAEHGCGNKLVRIGLGDCFATGYGTVSDLRQTNKLDGKSIYEKIKNALN